MKCTCCKTESTIQQYRDKGGKCPFCGWVNMAIKFEAVKQDNPGLRFYTLDPIPIPEYKDFGYSIKTQQCSIELPAGSKVINTFTPTHLHQNSRARHTHGRVVKLLSGKTMIQYSLDGKVWVSLNEAIDWKKKPTEPTQSTQSDHSVGSNVGKNMPFSGVYAERPLLKELIRNHKKTLGFSFSSALSNKKDFESAKQDVVIPLLEYVGRILQDKHGPDKYLAETVDEIIDEYRQEKL